MPLGQLELYRLRMDTDLANLLDEHERVFNDAVRTGDFARLVELFTPGAVLRFEGVAVGPFVGRAAIADAYATQPPTATFSVRSRSLGADGTVVQSVAWGDDPTPAGELVMRPAGGQIAELTVRFL
jgi:steroid delta-isomerase